MRALRAGPARAGELPQLSQNCVKGGGKYNNWSAYIYIYMFVKIFVLYILFFILKTKKLTNNSKHIQHIIDARNIHACM
jgi:hypothetical protein